MDFVKLIMHKNFFVKLIYPKLFKWFFLLLISGTYFFNNKDCSVSGSAVPF